MRASATCKRNGVRRKIGRAAEWWDYVIVGAGSAGCVLANRLSADPGISVLLLEAGGPDTYPWIHIPIGYLYTMNNPRTDWCFTTCAEPGLNGRRLAYPRGKVLGGCSSINGMIYARGQARDYDLWRQAGNPGWGWDDVLPYFKKSEDHFELNDDAHSQGGEWRVEEQRLSWDILDSVREAAEELGIPRVDDFNRGDNDGSSYFQVNQKSGIRWSTAKAFLRPARRRRNLKVLTGALVERLLIDGRLVKGLRFTRNRKSMEARARLEVILSAGAIGTPHILQLSGIGDPDRLSRFGITTRHAAPEVGRNLQDHLQIRTVFKISNARTLNDMSATLWGKLFIALEYVMRRSGPMAMAPSQLGIFTRSDASRETPNIEYHVQPLSLDRFGEPLHRFPAITVSVCNLRPTSRGEVAIRSADPLVAPAIRPNYLSTEDDRMVAVDSIRHVRKLMAAVAMKAYEPDEILPGQHIASDEALLASAGDIATTIFHPVGTARMGSDETALVDPRLRLRGLGGLRIADASVMPLITSGNTNSPVIMIAEKAADMIREDRGGQL